MRVMLVVEIEPSTPAALADSNVPPELSVKTAVPAIPRFCEMV